MASSTRSEAISALVDNTAPVQLCLSRDSRDSVVIHNNAGILYIKCGQNASSSDYTYCVTAGGTLVISRYIGPISAIASQATYVRVTELV